MLTWLAQVTEPPPLGLIPNPGCGPAAPSVALGAGASLQPVRLPVLRVLFAMDPPERPVLAPPSSPPGDPVSRAPLDLASPGGSVFWGRPGQRHRGSAANPDSLSPDLRPEPGRCGREVPLRPRGCVLPRPSPAPLVWGQLASECVIPVSACVCPLFLRTPVILDGAHPTPG